MFRPSMREQYRNIDRHLDRSDFAPVFGTGDRLRNSDKDHDLIRPGLSLL